MKTTILLKIVAIYFVVFFLQALLAEENDNNSTATIEYVESPGDNAAVKGRDMIIYGSIEESGEREWIAAQSYCNTIKIDSEEVEDSVFSLFEKFNDLKEICIQNVEAVRNPNVGKISGVKFDLLADKAKLSSIVLVNCALIDEGVKSLAMLHADKLWLGGRMPYLTENGIAHLGSMKSLKTLRLECRIANDRSIFFGQSMSALKQVEELRYRGDGKGYQKFFEGIGGMESLKLLELYIGKNDEICDNDFQFLSRLEKLEEFQLRGRLKNVRGTLVTYMKKNPKIKINSIMTDDFYYNGTVGAFDPLTRILLPDLIRKYQLFRCPFAAFMNKSAEFNTEPEREKVE